MQMSWAFAVLSTMFLLAVDLMEKEITIKKICYKADHGYPIRVLAIF